MRGIACLLLFVAACKFPELPPVNEDGGDGGGGDDGGDGPPGAPIVESTVPDDQGTGVEPRAAISATFSTPMLASSITTESFIVRSDATFIDGTVAYDDETRTATFTPAGRYALLADIEATITSAVTSADGVALAADVSWTFDVRDGVWGAQAPLETGNGDASTPIVVVGGRGDATAVWAQIGAAGRYDVWANRYDGEVWGNATTLDTADEQGSGAGGVVVDPTGAVTVAFSQVVGNMIFPFARRFVPGSGWGAVEMFGPSGLQQRPQIGVTDTGNVTAAWLSSGNVFMANTFVPGTGWGTHTPFSTGGSVGASAIGVDNGGNAMVVWIQNDGARNSVYWNQFRPGTGWGTRQLLETNDTAAASAVLLSVAPSGRAIAVYGLGPTTNGTYRARVFDTTGWTTDDELGVSAFSGEIASGAALAYGGDGVFAFVGNLDGGPVDMVVRRYTAAGGWEPAAPLENNESGSTDYPSAAIDRAGHAIVVWRHRNGTRPDVWANRYVPGVGWGTAGPIEGDLVEPVGRPYISIGPNREAVAVWETGSASPYNVYAAVFR
jgi:hypothetical protein